MAQDPRRFMVVTCPKGVRPDIKETERRRDFFADVGKVGDIEVLNTIGNGDVASGLRTLAKTSDSIRTGDMSSAIIPNSEGYVFQVLNINDNAAQEAGRFNPGVLNRATGEARSIIDKVKQGNYQLADIPGSFQDLQNLSSLIDGVFTSDTPVALDALCYATPYAVGLISYAPKYKFLFILQITLSDAYTATSSNANTLAFVIKSSTRPNINVEHEEVNMYNFWTRVPKRVVYEPVTMRFYDDTKNQGHMFYTTYLNEISPISRNRNVNNVRDLEDTSMEFNNKKNLRSASLAALLGNETTIIKEIKLFHFYDYGNSAVVYGFHKPKILSMNLDDLDMSESGNGNEIELQFAYDALHIENEYLVKEKVQAIKDISSLGGSYGIKPSFAPDDMTEGGYSKMPDIEDTNILTDISGSLSDALNTATGAINDQYNKLTGVASKAFDKASNFAGSVFK